MRHQDYISKIKLKKNCTCKFLEHAKYLKHPINEMEYKLLEFIINKSGRYSSIIKYHL